MTTGKKGNYYFLLVIFIFLFLIFPSKLVFAEESDKTLKECYYDIKMWCDGNLFNPDKSICDAELKIVVTEYYKNDIPHGEITKIDNSNGGTNKKWNSVYVNAFNDSYQWIKSSEVLAKCPETVEVINSKSVPGVTHIYVMHDNKKDDDGQVVSLKLEKDYRLCDEIPTLISNYDEILGESEEKITELEKILSEEQPDNERIDSLVNEITPSLVDVQSEIEDIINEDKYSFCTEWSDYTKETGELRTKIDALSTKMSSIKKSIEENEQISEDVRNKLDEMINVLENLKKVTYDAAISSGTEDINCGLLDPELVETIQKVLDIIRILVPILLIGFGTFDFGKAVILDDQDAMKKATSNFIKRCIAGILIFFIPTIVNMLLSMESIRDLIIDDPLCNIR